MNKALQVAHREIQATVTTKGFIIGVLITPILIVLSIQIFSRMHLDTQPRITGGDGDR